MNIRLKLRAKRFFKIILTEERLNAVLKPRVFGHRLGNVGAANFLGFFPAEPRNKVSSVKQWNTEHLKVKLKIG